MCDMSRELHARCCLLWRVGSYQVKCLCYLESMYSLVWDCNHFFPKTIMFMKAVQTPAFQDIKSTDLQIKIKDNHNGTIFHNWVRFVQLITLDRTFCFGIEKH